MRDWSSRFWVGFVYSTCSFVSDSFVYSCELIMIYKHHKGNLYNYFGTATGINNPCDDLKFFCEAKLADSNNRDGKIYKVYQDFNLDFFVMGIGDGIVRSLYQSLDNLLIWLRPVEEFREKFDVFPSKIKPSLNFETITFFCHGCQQTHTLPICPYEKGLAFSGTPDKPSLMPAVLITDGTNLCHSLITDGKIRYLSDSNHQLSGKEVELPDVQKL
jgi:hypothetical protein